VRAFRHALFAVRRYRGCLLAEPVGTGKTWVALAVARAFSGEAACIVPSILQSQWRDVARAAGVEITLTTHEQWSRGARPLGSGLVIVDESHRFRTEDTRRVAHLAPALVGRPGLLLSATPVINRLADLIAQLLLFVRDDALAAFGIESIRSSLTAHTAPQALHHLMVSGTIAPGGLPRKTSRWVTHHGSEELLMSRIERLQLSKDPAIRTLLLGGFALAEASSPSALLATLENYHLLLLQRRDADRNGRGPSRATIRRMLLGDLEQLVLWDLLQPESCDGADLTLADLPVLTTILPDAKARSATSDSKVKLLQTVLSDGRPTIVFVRARATVDYLRRILTPRSRVAWCSGSRAGIGSSHLPREAVLTWFRPDLSSRRDLAPTTLVTTDVSSEGLDLQRASRIIHYDLPWTHARLDQRLGRARRFQAAHEEVEVIGFRPPPELEARIGLLEALRDKRTLPARIGLRPARSRPPAENQPAKFAASEMGPARYSFVRTDGFSVLLAVRLLASGKEVSNLVLVQDRGGYWSETVAAARSALDAAHAALPSSWNMDGARRALDQADARIGQFVLRTAGFLWGVRSLSPGDRQAIARLSTLASKAFTRRDSRLLFLVDRGFRLVRRGHTLGEQCLVNQIGLGKSGAALSEQLSALPTHLDPRPPIQVEVTGMICTAPSGQGTVSDGFRYLAHDD